MDPVTASEMRFLKGKVQRVGLRQIGQMSGASRSTVSLALKDSPRVTPELKARIRDVAHRIGYTPNPYVSNVMSVIASGRWRAPARSIAIVVNGAFRDDASVQPVCDAIRAVSSNVGVALSIFHLRDPKSTSRLGTIFKARGINGGIFIGFESQITFGVGFPDVPLVVIGNPQAVPTATAVTHDRSHAIQASLQMLSERWFRRPFVLSFASDGITGGHETIGGVADVNSFRSPDVACVELISRVSEWISVRSPDVILGFGAATQKLLARTGVRLPYVDLEHATDILCAAAVVPDFEAIGRTAAELLISATYNSGEAADRSIRTILIRGQVHWRAGAECAKGQLRQKA